jgi:hypothetical protein
MQLTSWKWIILTEGKIEIECTEIGFGDKNCLNRVKTESNQSQNHVTTVGQSASQS